MTERPAAAPSPAPPATGATSAPSGPRPARPRAAGGLRAWLRAGSRSPVVPAAAVLLLFGAAAVAAGAAMAAGQEEAAQDQIARRSDAAASAVGGEVARYVGAVRTVAGALGSHADLDRREFLAATTALPELRLAGASSVAYLVPARPGDVPRTEAYWRARGDPGLRLQPTPGVPEHMFVIFRRPLDGANAQSGGIDAAASVPPAAALAAARRTGQAALSAPYELLIDRSLPPAQRQLSFTLAAPVYTPSAAAGPGDFRGWVVLGIRGRDLVAATLDRTAQGVVDVALAAPLGDGESVEVARLRAPVGGRRDLAEARDVPIADRSWRLRVAAPSRHLPGGATPLPALVTLAGVLVGALLGGLVWVLATARRRAEAQVVEATADLAVERAQAEDQAGLLAAILDSISDGVGVVDTDGEFLLHNPAARSMLGISDDRGGADNWQGHYGIFTPDGKEPFPTDWLPLVRALRGESTEQVEMIIRNRNRPEGVHISVSGRPLRGTRQQGAVAVFRDVTASKAAERELAATVVALREREADLRAFAEVVAHDLKGPLSGIAGYAELIIIGLREDTDPTDLADAAARVGAGVQRMRRLIEDLLAYATVRDGQLDLRPVDLGAVVADVLAELVEPVRRAGGTPPRVRVGPLPVVHADPVLVRQLLDNLIGNALKYTPPDRPAQIEIDAAPAEDGCARVVVADRGIGIPADQRESVFEAFHRAARGGYQGTGLGLAICLRVVQRHGGEITAAENPGGGTRVTFTLPRQNAAVSA
ncbi:hypothetical protein GCM10010124_33480 [Pilimelia terevasa]|uniref:Sensor-like histidine kinase SenX3 n=1 Tax=Pilimelia terevasa TaxID=53372 RepID=A0A8J3FJ85_9ACTN|nr:ATP-binding protein [Pilimelia terevasa]GGK37943.1 hypothetical protein GCM10010124_33480 [Pilimelia terevasa]